MTDRNPTCDPLLITEAEAAKLIGLTPRFLEARRRRGGGPPFVRISRTCVRYRPEDLRQWAEERLATSTADTTAAEAAEDV